MEAPAAIKVPLIKSLLVILLTRITPNEKFLNANTALHYQLQVLRPYLLVDVGRHPWKLTETAF